MAFPESLATERLLLRRAQVTDANDVFAYANNPEVVRLMTLPLAKSVTNPPAISNPFSPKWTVLTPQEQPNSNQGRVHFAPSTEAKRTRPENVIGLANEQVTDL